MSFLFCLSFVVCLTGDGIVQAVLFADFFTLTVQVVSSQSAR